MRLRRGGRTTPNGRVHGVLKRLLLPDFHFHEAARENKKDLSAGPVILRRVAGRMRGTMYRFRELFDTFAFWFNIATP